MTKDDTEKLNVKVDTKLTETLAEAKSDTVENQKGTQNLGFDCKSRVAEKTVNTKENKKQAKQEKRKRKDDKTDTDPQKMYRGNDQSHNADKRRNRFDREKREPEISATKEEFVFFWKSHSPYSQWYISDFTVKGNTFNCAEQYMMYSKAMLFDDKETADAILKESDPRNHKWLGRRVQNFDQKKWDKNCMDIVKRGNKAKFFQNEKLYKTIIDTHPKTLVEASPMDKIWGIGLAANDYRARNRKSWRGKNLLGEALTEVRDELIQEEKSGKHDKRDTSSQNISETRTDNNDTQGSTDDRLKDETENTEELKAKTTVPETGDMTAEQPTGVLQGRRNQSMEDF